MSEEAKGPCACHSGSCVFLGTTQERVAAYNHLKKTQPIPIPAKKKRNTQRPTVPPLKHDKITS